MKKKVKKIPKYAEGTVPFYKNTDFYSQIGDFAMQQYDNVQQSKEGVTTGGVAKGAITGGLAGAGVGTMIAPGIGTAIGAGVGALAGGITSAIGSGASYDGKSSSTDFNQIYQKGSGIASWFDDEAGAIRGATMVQNANIAKQQTQMLRAKYSMNPNNPVNPIVNAAEGGIMRKPVDALVSKGELIYDPTTKKLRQVPGSKGKPNKADDIYAKLYEGDVVISNSPTMLMANGKTPAQNLMGMVDKYATGGTVKAREAIIKKVVNWQEANKTKPQEYAKFSTGTSNVESADDVSFDKDMYAQMLSMLPMINRINFEKYNKMQNDYALLGFSDTKPGDNLKKNDKVAAYQKLYDELTFGNERIDQMRREGRIKGKGGSADKAKTWNDGLPGTQTWLRHLGKNLSTEQMNEINSLLSQQGLEAYINDNGMVNYRKLNKPVSRVVTNPKIEVEDEIIDEVQIPDYDKWIADPQKQYNKGLRKLRLQKMRNSLGELGKAAFDIAPMAAALFGDYDYHTEQAQISPAKYIPTGVSIDPIRRAADEGYAMARYNQANINPNTGAGMTYGLQAASNRAKTLADAYTWQQDAQNKLIAQNTGIYNDWTKRYDVARYQAIADTRANEGAAQQMRDSAIRDAYEFMAGRRNDRMRLTMMKPLAKYAFDDGTYKKIYSSAIE